METRTLILPILVSLISATGAMAQVGPATTRASVSSLGVQADADCSSPHISDDGQLVVFSSVASTLVPNDTNAFRDVFVSERTSGILEHISVSTAGAMGNYGSFDGDISGDGRFVVFSSYATNLVAAPPIGLLAGVYLRDRGLGTTTLIAESTNLGGHAAISGDGRLVAFESDLQLSALDLDTYPDIYLWDRISGVFTLASRALPGSLLFDSHLPAISSDGRHVAFQGQVPLQGQPYAVYQILLFDSQLGTTEAISLTPAGAYGYGPSQNAAVSGDGRYVTFSSVAGDLVVGDAIGYWDMFLRDRLTGVTELLSLDSHEVAGPTGGNAGGISDDGRHISMTGTFAAGDSNGVSDVYCRDLWNGVGERVSLNAAGDEADGYSTVSRDGLSADGRFIVFRSAATNLVAGDTNGVIDIFVHDRLTGGPELNLTNVVAGQTANFNVEGATPSGPLFVGFSLAPQGVTLTPWGLVELGGPIAILALAADAQGKIAAPVGLPFALQGAELWVQGIDLAAAYPTAVWGGFVQ